MTEHLHRPDGDSSHFPDSEIGILSLTERISHALSRRQAIDPREQVNYNGERMAIEEVPSLQARWMMGYGHDPADVRQRTHHPRGEGQNWAYTPSTCLVASQGSIGVWIDDSHLTCPGCGLDFT